jgi:Holliday junction resolvasome RuvABC ATP-dependent DNA helicase subunit
MRYEGSGNAEEIIPQILQFLAQVVPTYNLARRLIYVPDLAGLLDRIANIAKMTNTGQLLLARNKLPSDKAISVILFMAQLAAKMGKRENDSLSIEEIAVGVSKAPKTIRNVIVALQKSSQIERTDRGRYRITAKGLIQLETSLPTGTEVSQP